MYNLSRILICLDLSDMDDQLIKAAATMADFIKAKSLYFLHVVQSLELPGDIVDKYPDLIAPVDENVKRIISEKLDQNFKNLSEFDHCVDVIEGSTVETILKWSKIKEVDLIIMGKKMLESGSGLLTERIVKLCHCSFLLVPFNSYHGLKRIMVSIDFSENSKMALEQAMVIAKDSGASIICQHCYNVPVGYHSTGKSYAEFSEIMRTNSVKDFRNFLLGMGLMKDQYPCIFTLVADSDISHSIHETALKEKIDLIIMASKGRTGLASILLGSVAMKTVKYDLEVELMVVKDKKENMGFLQALLNI